MKITITVNMYYLICQKTSLPLFKIIENIFKRYPKIIQGGTHFFQNSLKG